MTLRQRVAFAAVAVVAGTSLFGVVSQTRESLMAATPADGDTLFAPFARVLMHPRCMNCHQVDFPRQTDNGIRHTQLVVRGIGGASAHDGGHGAPTLQCNACHQATNTADGRMPGTANWQLAPVSMKWADMSAAQICAQLKDPERNGHRHNAREIVEHMGAYGAHTDPLVLWAWNPGANRTTPPISHAQFVRALEGWAEAGMPCPSEAPNRQRPSTAD